MKTHSMETHLSAIRIRLYEVYQPLIIRFVFLKSHPVSTNTQNTQVIPKHQELNNCQFDTCYFLMFHLFDILYDLKYL